jgi:hypothetical protein
MNAERSTITAEYADYQAAVLRAALRTGIAG